MSRRANGILLRIALAIHNLEQNLPTWAAIHIVARYAGVNCRPPADAKASFNTDQRPNYLSGLALIPRVAR